MFTFPLHVELVILLKYGIKRFPLSLTFWITYHPILRNFDEFWLLNIYCTWNSRFALKLPGVIYIDANIGWFIRQNLET